MSTRLTRSPKFVLIGCTGASGQMLYNNIIY